MAQVVVQGEQAIAEVGLRTRAQRDNRTGSRQRSRFVIVHVRGVYEAPVVTQLEILEQPAHRAPAVGGVTLINFAALLGHVDVHGYPRAGGSGNLPQRFLRNGPETVCPDADHDVVRAVRPDALEVRQEILDRHRETRLPRGRLRILEAGTLVMHWHISQPDAAVGGGGRDRLEHRVVGIATCRIAMQVMEFGNRREASAEHLAIGLSGDRGQRGRVDPASKLIHALAPGPEVVTPLGRSLLGVTRQRPLKRMAVRIAQAGNNTAERLIRIAAVRAGG